MTDFLSVPLSADGAKGLGSMLAEGSYKNCTITDVSEVERSEEQIASGINARVKVTFSTADMDGPINGYINIKDPASPHKKSAMFALLSAIWPNEAEREGKSPKADWPGQVVDILVVHKQNQGGNTYAELNYRATKAAKASA